MPLILLAEDESSTIDHVRSALSSQGWLVKTVGDRDQALRAASEFAPQLVLVNDQLTGAEDLVRTFSRRSGGPGVILLSARGGDSEGSEAPPDVDAVLAKPLDVDNLIETIRQGLVNGKTKPAPPPVADAQQVFSSEEIFGDLLDDIIDPAAAATEEAAEAKSAPETSVSDEPAVEVDAAAEETPPPPVAERQPEQETEPVATEPKAAPIEAPQRVAAGAPEKAKPEPPDTAAAAPGDGPDEAALDSGLEDLEEVVREGVEAWADSMEPEAEEEAGPSEQLAELAEAAQPPPEPEPEEDLESKLEDTLSGVLAASLSQAEPDSKVEAPDSTAASSVDALLSQALGDLNLDSVGPTPTLEDVAESQIDDEIEALTAAVEVDPIAEIETPDFTAALDELTGAGLAVPDEEPAVEEEEAREARIEADVAEPLDAEQESADLKTAPEILPAEETEVEIEVEAEPAAATLPAGVEFGEYTLEQQIGVGGMASVWKARRKGVEGFEKRVAIKKILPQAAENEDFVEMFIDEAKLAAQLNHNNITHIYDLGKIDDDYFIAMEYVEGRNLRQILDRARKKQHKVPVGVALFVASQLADALDYAHRSKDFDDTDLGLVHRDVSPQNVLISFNGDIKLCDFGIAKAVSKISTTQMGALKGKLQYMSPEQAWGKAIDHRSDLFSLGTLLYEMIAGKRLFTGDSEMAVLEAVRQADVGTQIIQSGDIPAGVKGLLLRSLAREPDDRFESAAQLHRGVEELLKEESPVPDSRSLAAFVRDLLDMQPEPQELEPEEEPPPPIAVDDQLEWIPEAAEEAPAADEGQQTPWLRKMLKRLLPVILIVAVGGGIITALMRGDSPATPASTEPAVILEPAVSQPGDSDGESTVDPQGQPPPADAHGEPTPAPPAQTPPPEPEPNPDPTPPADPPATKPAVEVIDKTPAPAPAPPKPADPELEKEVEEDLQRVQELMGATEQPAPAVATASEPDSAPVEPITLESLWSDVTAAEGSTDGLVQPGPGVIEPRILQFESPAYPEAARQAGIEGTIRVSVLVSEDGTAQEVRLMQGLDSQVGLEEAVIEAARKALYEPASKDGEPVEMWYQVAVLYPPP